MASIGGGNNPWTALSIDERIQVLDRVREAQAAVHANQ